MGLSDTFNAVAEHKERIFSDLNGHTVSLGHLLHKPGLLVFEPQEKADIGICAHYAARLPQENPGMECRVVWRGKTYDVIAGMTADEIAMQMTGQPAPGFDGDFTTKFRMPPEAVRRAIEGDDIGALRTCMQNNAFPDTVFDDGNTPLTLAVKQGRNYVDLLVKHGANVNLPAKDGVTPLMAAALNGDVETARVLIDAGADINATDTSGRAVPVHATNTAIRDFLEGPYPAEAAERIRRKKEAEQAAATAAATVLQHDVKPMSPLKLKKKPGADS